MNNLYKIEWEMVSALGKGSVFYRNEQPTCKPSAVPEEFWSKIFRETDNPWQQFNQLKKWAETGEQLIRNVKLLQMVSKPEYKEIE